MRFKITPQVVDFIRNQLPDTRGYQAELCRRFDIDQPHLNMIVGGRRKFVQDEIWNKLCNAFPGLDGLSSPIFKQRRPQSIRVGNHSNYNIISSPNAVSNGNIEKLRADIINALVAIADPQGNIKLVQALKAIQEV